MHQPSPKILTSEEKATTTIAECLITASPTSTNSTLKGQGKPLLCCVTIKHCRGSAAGRGGGGGMEWQAVKKCVCVCVH